MALVPMRGMHRRWLLHCAVLPVVFILAAGPLLVLNTIQFHSPFKTGYDFWAPFFKEHHLLFSLRYIPNNAINLWKELTVQPLGFHTANTFGTGTSFVPTFLLLVCIGLFFIRIDRFVICAFLAWLTFLAVVLSHNDYLVDTRYYLPLLILLVAVAVLPVTWAAQNILAGRRVLTAAAVLVLFGAACLGYPSRSGYNTREIDRLQAWDALHFGSPPRQSTWFIAQGRFLEDFGKQQPGIVLSDIDPVYLNSFFPSWIVAAPLDGQHRYKWTYRWRYDRPQALALVEHGLHEKQAVYALFVSGREMEEKMARLPHVDGYEWVLAEDPTAEAAILKLSPTS